MRREGLTKIELLVVIGVIVLAVAILMPVRPTHNVRGYHQCRVNLVGIGKAMVLYSQDNGGDYPVAGGAGASWNTLGGVSGIGWLKGWPPEAKKWGVPPLNRATITSCFYLLVRYEMAEPKQFVCGGDGATIYVQPMETSNALDFGDGAQMWPGQCCSYSYHMPFSVPDAREGREGELTNFAINDKSADESPVCADRNP
ncbi:MAG: type II secretion system protein, partial [Planctomycetota bacterium]